MIARSAQSALVVVMVMVLLGLGAPQAVQAHERESSGYGYRQDYRGDDDDDGPRYAPPRGRAWIRPRTYYAAPIYYPDVVVYPRVMPRAYYYAPVEPVYPREYGSIGIHLDYNYRY